MNKIFSLLAMLLAAAPLILGAEEKSSSSEIRVHLSTDTSLSPLYLGKFQLEKAGHDAVYANQLEEVLQNDLNFNGFTKVLPRNEQKEFLLLEKENASAFNPKEWKNFGVAHVVKGVLNGNTLTLSLFSVQNSSLKHFKEIPLTGKISQDRYQIHKAADGITHALFQTQGVANSRILYALQMKSTKNEGSDWISEIWECDWDGSNARQVTREGSYSVSPVFVPAPGKSATDRFIYVSYKHSQPKIFIATLKEGIGKRLVDLRGNQLLPAISPKRDKIAFICDAGGRTDLFLQTFNEQGGELEKPVQLFSYPRSTQASPTFSPDASKLAFVSDKDGSMRIYVIPTTIGSKRPQPVMITKENRENSCPSWSPDGRKLAYSAKTNGVRQIWIYDFPTGEEKQLTYGPGNKENPSWAPDSLHLVFNSTDPTSSELYIVNLNQPEAIKISKGTGKKHYPTWGTR